MYITCDGGKITLLKAFSSSQSTDTTAASRVKTNTSSFSPLSCHCGGRKAKTDRAGGFWWGEGTSAPKIKQRELFPIDHCFREQTSWAGLSWHTCGSQLHWLPFTNSLPKISRSLGLKIRSGNYIWFLNIKRLDNVLGFDKMGFYPFCFKACPFAGPSQKENITVEDSQYQTHFILSDASTKNPWKILEVLKTWPLTSYKFYPCILFYPQN